MKTIQISEDNALKAYNAGDDSQKSLLENLFGKESFVPKDIKERVKTFEDAAAIVGVNENQKILLAYNGIDKEMIAAVALLKLYIIRTALNEGWIPDWGNDDEYKYYAWFNMPGSGSGFSFRGCDFSYARSFVGARLAYKSRELAEYAGKQFLDLYKDLFVL